MPQRTNGENVQNISSAACAHSNAFDGALIGMSGRFFAETVTSLYLRACARMRSYAARISHTQKLNLQKH